MMDVQELRSFPMTQKVKSGESVGSATSGGEFDETLSGCSQRREVFSEGSSSDEEVPGLPVSGTSDTAKTGEFCEEVLPAPLFLSKEEVQGLPDDPEGDQGVSSPRGAGARVYRQLLSGGGTSSEEALLDGFRQLKLSAHVFGAKTGPESDASDGDSQDASDTTETEHSAIRDGLTGILAEGVLPLAGCPFPVHDGVSSGSAERGPLLPGEGDKGILEGQQGVSAEEVSLSVDDLSRPFSQGQGSVFPYPFVQEEESTGLPQEEFSHGSRYYEVEEGGYPSVGSSVRPQESAGVQKGIVPVAESVSASGQPFSAAVSAGWQEVLPGEGQNAAFPVAEEFSTAVSVGRQDLLPEPLAMEGVPPPVNAVYGGDEPVNSALVGDLLTDLSRPGPETENIPLTPSTSIDEEGYVAGQNLDVLIDHGKTVPMENPEFTLQGGREGIVPELEKAPGVKEDQQPPLSFALNPMEAAPVKVAGGDVFLEARGVEAMARGLAETIQVVRKKDGHTGTIEVSPPHLGQVKITVESSGDTLQVHLRVESVQVRDMLDQTADVLKQALADKGISLTGMSVDVGGQGAGESSQGRGSGSDQAPGYLVDNVAEPLEDEAEEIIARLDLERGMLHWVA